MNLKEMSIEELRNLIAEANAEINSRIGEKVKVTIKLEPRYKCWAKVLTGVDTTKSNGFAFIGNFVKVNELIELPVGVYVLAYQETGSERNKDYEAELFITTNNGLEKTGVRVSSSQNDWALKIRDDVKTLIERGF
jgi:hypothetical protein